MRLRASEIAAATGGVLHGDDLPVHEVHIDSRTVGPGHLFVAVVGDRDGHAYVPDAHDRGAHAHLTQDPDTVRHGPAVLVDDTGLALIALGRAARERLPDRVVGITGSVGKTTAKDMLRAVLGRRFTTAASERSFNNEMGVPLTLLNAPDGTDAAVVEMGARGVGHIALLADIARPSIGVVTVVAGAHLEQFGGLEGVARAKGELVEALPADGFAVLNADDALVAAMASRTAAAVWTFGRSAGLFRAESVEVGDDLRARFRLRTPHGSAPVEIGARGAHQVTNALAAATAALAAGATLDDVVAGLAVEEISPLRMDLGRAPSGALVLNDSYNANPTSMRAALEALAAVGAKRRIAVLGHMAELGPDADSAHRDIARHAAHLGIEVLAFDAAGYGAPGADTVDGVLALLGPLGDGDAVLCKGSRVAGVERVADALLTRG